ncbi:MAG TPA: CBS domain-containing protein [Thermoleophilia bacterium]|nr:CBS domain-containing protein [Thermoleophilia bacterium]
MAVTLKDFMTAEDVLTIEPGLTLAAAAESMSGRNVGAAVVVEGGRVVGIFTERDLLRAVGRGTTPADAAVRDHMTPDPVTLPSDHAPSEAAAIMSERRFRHIPVIDGGELVGIVSIRDLISADLHIHTADAHVGSDFP